jgi:hypothetical protein
MKSTKDWHSAEVSTFCGGGAVSVSRKVRDDNKGARLAVGSDPREMYGIVCDSSLIIWGRGPPWERDSEAGQHVPYCSPLS